MGLRSKIQLVLVICLLGLGGGLFYYVWQTDIFQLRAEEEIVRVCNNQRALNNFYGSSSGAVSSQLTDVNFMGHSVSFHKIAAPWLQDASYEIGDKKINYGFNDVSTFNWRQKRYGGGRSLHAYGIAIDINPGNNPYTGGRGLVTDIPNEVRDIMKNHGFYWGGDWNNYRDAMHFEWYGGSISGNLKDSQTNQDLKDVDILFDGKKINGPYSGHYEVYAPAGSHTFTYQKTGYQTQEAKLDVFCNQDRGQDIWLNPITLGQVGSVSGTIKPADNKTAVILAEVLVDGARVGFAAPTGDYKATISAGINHTIEARTIGLLSGSIQAQVQKDENKTGIDISVK